MRLTAILLSVGLGLLSSPAAFPAERFLAQGAFCDTEAHATQFVKAWDGKNAPEAIAAINATTGKESCHLSLVTLEEIERTTKLTTPTGTWQLVKLHVWATRIGDVMLTFSVPLTQYTYVQVDQPEQLGQAI